MEIKMKHTILYDNSTGCNWKFFKVSFNGDRDS